MKFFTLPMLREALSKSSDYDGFMQEILKSMMQKRERLGLASVSLETLEAFVNGLYDQISEKHYRDMKGEI